MKFDTLSNSSKNDIYQNQRSQRELAKSYLKNPMNQGAAINQIN
jgi:hypothetical protein